MEHSSAEYLVFLPSCRYNSTKQQRQIWKEKLQTLGATVHEVGDDGSLREAINCRAEKDAAKWYSTVLQHLLLGNTVKVVASPAHTKQAFDFRQALIAHLSTTEAKEKCVSVVSCEWIQQAVLTASLDREPDLEGGSRSNGGNKRAREDTTQHCNIELEHMRSRAEAIASIVKGISKGARENPLVCVPKEAVYHTLPNSRDGSSNAQLTKGGTKSQKTLSSFFTPADVGNESESSAGSWYAIVAELHNEQPAKLATHLPKNLAARYALMGDCYYYIHKDFTVPDTVQIAAFDLDDTLVKPKSGKKFPKSAYDWKWTFTSVPEVLSDLQSTYGYQIAIFSNQLGIAKGQVSEDDARGRIEEIARALDKKRCNTDYVPCS
eukprot:gb/GECG01008631.1/.p1 GENE.gb/GECG01008631.1/~~gb/GECG01008631.1/.p1  ORF type:complete len:378 (+),score=54.59 gb/GECG01008631.1/:1-1134(+)